MSLVTNTSTALRVTARASARAQTSHSERARREPGRVHGDHREFEMNRKSNGEGGWEEEERDASRTMSCQDDGRHCARGETIEERMYIGQM